MPTTNAQLAAIFHQMADLTEITGGNRFKVNAFAKSGRVLEDMTKQVSEIDPALLPKVEGIGKGTAERIAEFLETGQIADHQKLLAQVPSGLLKVMDVPGLGPKTVALLWNEVGIESIDDLKAKIETGELEALKGFGKKKIENILKNLKFAESAGDRQRIGLAYALAIMLIEDLKDLPSIEKIEYAGSLRRGKETIGDVDILVASSGTDEQKKAIFDAFVNHVAVADVIAHGDTKASVRTHEESKGMQVDLRVVAPENFGAALMYFTGSKEHNVKMRERAIAQGMSLNEYSLSKDGEPIAGATEEDVFAAMNLAWVAPELREDRGELALAESDELPKLLELADIKAELHSHTTASDGRWSIEENALGAAGRGFHTVAITDHSKGQAQANGLSEKRLVQHIEAVRKVAKKLEGTITVLAGSEVDILADGSLDYDDDLLAELDIVVASPHAALTQDPAKATKRLLKAIENPYVTIVGHPTGRIVNRREGLSPDMEAIFKAAKDRGIALEINASPYRLDLRDTHARTWVQEYGGKLAINTDAHSEDHLNNLRFGVVTARRAGATTDDVVNTMSKSTLAKWIKSTRP
ncbi:DNA polymerase/3'-5' exonuclease PolX [Algisphaera agarilytica]|uniref:DNA polymerase beta n=1 Tax=Algisphaera agarilytica TaxID=1385975 RepID=A0A7X0H8D4_9BACT|nr:DNA polymerase/3'-5' exonuclease PolX [Algisphaera agarilytica]MBB6429699.1 DNA polymerase (family 10) [Algisphaera agarilytica]